MRLPDDGGLSRSWQQQEERGCKGRGSRSKTLQEILCQGISAQESGACTEVGGLLCTHALCYLNNHSRQQHLITTFAQILTFSSWFYSEKARTLPLGHSAKAVTATGLRLTLKSCLD